MRLQLQVLLQALEDILTYELNLPHAGISDEEYEDALAYISQFPKLMHRWKKTDKKKWLKELQAVKDELS